MTTESNLTRRSTLRRRPFKGRTAVRLLILVAGALALLVWYRIASTPDVGEPFDVRAFLSFSIPDDQNAFTYYRKATVLFIDEPSTVSAGPSRQVTFRANYDDSIRKGWPLANKDCRQWLTANRAALDLWKRGTECLQAMETSPADLGPLNLPDCGAPRRLARLSLLEAARVSADKSPAEAWIWYRAALRFSRHAAMHSASLGRMIGTSTHSAIVEPILHWSADPKLTAGDLRHALADVVAIDAMTPPLSDNFKAEYLFCRAHVKEASAGWSGLPLRLTGYSDRVQRALNLIYANWLSQVDRPRFDRVPAKGRPWLLFELDPAAPRDPKVKSPAEIEDRCGLAQNSSPSTLISLLMPSVTSVIDAADRERANQAALVLGLAVELYYREHSRFPAALDELVRAGYLESIPRDPFGRGEPFHYRREADARKSAILWSVWTDGIDQHGTIKADAPRFGDPGDKIFRIASPK